MAAGCRLENGSIRFDVNSGGVITSIYNKRTKTEFIEKGKSSGWKLIVSLREWTEYPIFDYMNSGEIKRSGDAATVSFRRLKGLEGDILPISMDLAFRLDNEEIVMEARIKNGSPETVRECWFPLLSGLTKVGKKRTSYLTIPFWMGSKVADPADTLPLAWDAKWKLLLMYPGICSMPWFDFYDNKQGLYLASHDPSFQTTTLVTRRRQQTRDFQMGIVKYPFIGSGESWSSGDLVISAHEGDWHAGAKKYRAFADTWLEAASDIPKWIFEAPGVCDLFMKHQNKRIYFGYDELLRIDNENRKKGLDIPLYVFSWYKNGHDVGYPEYSPDPRMGGRAKLRSVLKRINNNGGHVILYTQGRLIDLQTDYYKRMGKKICIVNDKGVFYPDNYSWPIQGTVTPNKIFAIACPATEEWKRRLISQAFMVDGFGANGLLYDQIGGDHPYLCFAKDHGHSKPGNNFAKKVGMLRELRRTVKARNPDLAIMLENICDAFAQYADLIHSHYENFRTDEMILPMPELFRYTFPEMRLSSRDACDIPSVNYTFILGLRQEYWRMTEPFEHTDRKFDNDPKQRWIASYMRHMLELKAYTEKLFRFKQRWTKYLITADFADSEGLSWSPKDVELKRFIPKDNDGEAVLAWNRSDKAKTVRVRLTRAFCKVILADINGKRALKRGDRAEFRLGPDAICALILKD